MNTLSITHRPIHPANLSWLIVVSWLGMIGILTGCACPYNRHVPPYDYGFASDELGLAPYGNPIGPGGPSQDGCDQTSVFRGYGLRRHPAGTGGTFSGGARVDAERSAPEQPAQLETQVWEPPQPLRPEDLFSTPQDGASPFETAPPKSEGPNDLTSPPLNLPFGGHSIQSSVLPPTESVEPLPAAESPVNLFSSPVSPLFPPPPTSTERSLPEATIPPPPPLQLAPETDAAAEAESRSSLFPLRFPPRLFRPHSESINSQTAQPAQPPVAEASLRRHSTVDTPSGHSLSTAATQRENSPLSTSEREPAPATGGRAAFRWGWTWFR